MTAPGINTEQERWIPDYRSNASDGDAFRLGREPSLDGLRGLSILVVLGFNGHLQFLRGGFIGVDLFFVLSGFLITALLVQEYRQTLSIRFRDFYIRRALRLFPALFALILVCVVLSITQTPEKASGTMRGIFYTLIYAANWAQVPPNPPGIGPLSHAWSLSVEEQFYIAWPLILFALLKIETKWAILSVLSFMIAASIFVNVWLWRNEVPYLRMYFGTDTRANEILIGCVAALLLYWGWLKRTDPLKWVLHSAALAGLLFLAWCFFGLRHWGSFVYNGGFPLVALATAILIADLMLFPSLISRCFEFAPLVWFGKISYGLYLWHFPIFEASRTFLEGRMSFAAYSLIGLAVTLLVTTASYYFLERPILKLKSRLRIQHDDTRFIMGSASSA